MDWAKKKSFKPIEACLWKILVQMSKTCYVRVCVSLKGQADRLWLFQGVSWVRSEKLWLCCETRRNKVGSNLQKWVTALTTHAHTPVCCCFILLQASYPINVTQISTWDKPVRSTGDLTAARCFTSTANVCSEVSGFHKTFYLNGQCRQITKKHFII